jgi:hypothetical protein
MEKQMIQLNIPVPPAPLLEQAVGYRNFRNAHYLALWWEPCGDEAMVSDGLVTFTGLWPGYLAYVQHKSVHPHLTEFNLGSSECPADHHLVIDLVERQAFIAPCKVVDRFQATQWKQGEKQEKHFILSSEEMEKWVEELEQQLLHFPSMDELMLQIAEDDKRVAALEHWLDGQTPNP